MIKTIHDARTSAQTARGVTEPDSSLATPSLGGGPFTADAILVKNYIRTTNVNDPITQTQTFSGDQFQSVTGFTLGGSAVTVPGLNSAFGLYFHISPAGSFPINGSGMIIGPAHYTALDLEFVADVGDDDGTLSSNSAGIGFSNPANTANDVTLATGHLLAASLSVDAQGTRLAHYLTTFTPSAGEADFFVAPDVPVSWEEFLNSPAAAFTVTPVNALTVINSVSGDGDLGSHGFAQLVPVPEPAPFGILAASLFGLGFVRHRRS